MKPLVYRSPLDPNSDGYAPWVRALGQRSGAYVIRSKRTGEIRYVGNSHTGRLYDTLTRHFQNWSSSERVTAALEHYAHGGRGVGPTFDPSRCEVAVVLTPPNRAEAVEARLILQLNPTVNKLYPVEAPF
jgi:hypothetical protein